MTKWHVWFFKNTGSRIVDNILFVPSVQGCWGFIWASIWASETLQIAVKDKPCVFPVDVFSLLPLGVAACHASCQPAATSLLSAASPSPSTAFQPLPRLPSHCDADIQVPQRLSYTPAQALPSVRIVTIINICMLFLAFSWSKLNVLKVRLGR